MSVSSENLTRPQERLIAALLTARTIGDAARAAKTSEPTARRWLALPHVRRAYMDARRQVVQQALATAQAATRAAVATLLDCMQAKHPASVRVRAATAVLELAVRAVEVDDLAARVEQLEQLMAEHER